MIANLRRLASVMPLLAARHAYRHIPGMRAPTSVIEQRPR
jgi:hypothetical protein